MHSESRSERMKRFWAELPAQERLNRMKTVRAANTEGRNMHGPRKRPYESLFNWFVYISRQNNRPVELSFQEFLLFVQEKECCYCGAEIVWSPYQVPGASTAYNLDRKDSSLSYTRENCVVACASCNRVKSNVFTYMEMKMLGESLRKIREARGLTIPYRSRS